MLNFDKFDFPAIFAVVKSTESMKRRQLRTFRSEIQERGIAKYSGGQLSYVGDTEVGKDFIGNDETRYESKSQDGLFCKRIPFTKEIVLKNFQGKSLGMPEKTFDYMLLWDTKEYSVGICSWDACMKNVTVRDATVVFRVHRDDITFLATKVVPPKKEDLGKMIFDFIDSSL